MMGALVVLGNLGLLLLVLHAPHRTRTDLDLRRCYLAPGESSIFSSRHLICWPKHGFVMNNLGALRWDVASLTRSPRKRRHACRIRIRKCRSLKTMSVAP
jgi:hypothetical protein